ncbi:MAG: response regulator transcription factor [Oscillospiraceae bacterium]|jgi:two-component system LytT family response regulator|nr:response regulator transcription factor [Oscillospiraceae bacterium]
MAVRIMLADDEAGMRLALRSIIETMEGFAIVGEAENGARASVLAAELRPDVIFLDVEMPEMNGTEAAKVISSVVPDAMLIFVTAHSEYMPAAFEVYAFDYIVKPFKSERVMQTLRRAEKNLSMRDDGTSLLIKGRETISFVPLSSVLMACREGNETRIVTADESYQCSSTLAELWPKLEGRGFIKTHRSYIVRASAITKLAPYGRWTYSASLRGSDATALVTHDKLDELQQLLGAL